MAHDNHGEWRNDDSRPVLFDGCDECTYRSMHLAVAIARMDNETFKRAWRRAGISHQFGLDTIQDNEADLFAVLAQVRNCLQRVHAIDEHKMLE